MAQIIEKITTVEFEDEISRQEYFEKHKHQFAFAQFNTFEDKFYHITWYDLEEEKIDWAEQVDRISDLCTKCAFKKPIPGLEIHYDFSKIE